nr:papain-like cysteine protease family protein [Emticicia sp. TH156]
MKLIPQTDMNSCWAASMAMVSLALDDEPKSQEEFIKLRNNAIGLNEYPYRATTIPDDDMADFTAENLSGYTSFTEGSLGLHQIKQLLEDSKPVIYDYKLNSNTQSHLVVMDKVEKTAVLPDKCNISWIHISDPWPINQGNGFYITYERYYGQGKIDDSDSGPRRKYTITLLTNNRPNLNNDDIIYLSNVFFKETSDELIRAFLKHVEALPDTHGDSFYDEINFNKSLAAATRVSKGYRVLNVGTRGTFADSGVKIETLLGMDADTYIYFLGQNNKITTIITTAKVRNPHNQFGFNDNWIINHIERADRFESMAPILERISNEMNW